MMWREPAVAGQFYPSDPQQLTRQLSRFCQPVDTHDFPLAIISPHAGYLYSGRIAGQVFSASGVPDRVILLGPNHRGMGHEAAISPEQGWRTPLGDIRIDRELTDRIMAVSPLPVLDSVAHSLEHSLEVQVPFIQFCNPASEFVPLCISHLPVDDLVSLGEALADVVASFDEPILLIASSDMTHFESAEAAREKDELALERVRAIDPEGLYRVVRDHRISMCGVLPTVVALAAARALGATEGELVAYGHSGDVTGDHSDVVGYAGVMIRRSG